MANNTSIAEQLLERQRLLDSYLRVEFVSAICLVILSPITVFTNLILLSAIWRDPLRCFRTPTTYFIVGLGVADLVTGLVVEPSFALYFLAKHYKVRYHHNLITTLNQLAGGVSTVAISTSFLLVLGLSVSQYIAVNFPHRFKRLVTKRNVLVYVIVSWVYFILFSLLKLTNMSQMTFFKIDVALHPTFISIVLLVVHVLTYRAFRKHVRKREKNGAKSKTLSMPSVDRANSDADIERETRLDTAEAETVKLTNRKEKKSELKIEDRRRKRLERQFTLVVLHLATILLVSAFFHTVVFYIYIYKKPDSFKEVVYVNMALRLSDLMLFVKVALDAFVYAWRLPTYRKAIITTLFCSRSRPPTASLM